MNFYEKHVGDYIRDTVGLSMTEDGAYNRLLDQVYQTEKPLPLDRKEVYRMARATSAAERKAVDYVLAKFFEQTESGYIQKRAMEILGEFWDRPERPEKNTKEGNRERQRKCRERRKTLFDALAGHGVVPAYNTPMRDLEVMLSRYQSQSVTQESRDMSRPVTDSVMALVMANHSPVTSNQKEIPPNPLPPVGGMGEEGVNEENPSGKAQAEASTQTAEYDGRDAGKPGRQRKPRTTLKSFLADCKANGIKPVTSYRPLMEYVEGLKLPGEFLALAWDVFCREHLDGGANANRTKADWRRHFANYVEKGYYRLWFCRPDGTFELTSQGLQAKAFHNGREAA